MLIYSMGVSVDGFISDREGGFDWSAPSEELFRFHLAFPAEDDATVRAFHAAALAAGYEDNGGPGERAVYHPGYYGAFVLDPDGNNIEAVCHSAPSA